MPFILFILSNMDKITAVNIDVDTVYDVRGAKQRASEITNVNNSAVINKQVKQSAIIYICLFNY
jgi:hypothetical protein